MTGDCGTVHDQLNFPSPLTVQERVKLELTSSDERVTLAAGTNSGGYAGLMTAANKILIMDYMRLI